MTPTPALSRRQTLFAVIVVAVSGLGVLATAELTLRIYDVLKTYRHRRSLPPIDQRVLVPSEDAELAWELNSGWSDGEFTVNSLGLADDEVERAKPPGALRITVVGDSITCNFGHRPRDEIYLEVLEQMLNERDTAGRHECLNLGVNGYGVRQAVRVVETRMRELAPDLLVVQLGLNDPYPSDTAYGRHAPAPTLRIRDFLERRLRPARFWARIYVERLYDEEGRRNVERALRELAAAVADGPPTLILLFPYLHAPAYREWGFEQYHLVFEEAARVAGLPLVDLRGPFAAAGLIDDRWPRDPIHPGAAGHRIAAEVLLRELDQRGWLPPAGRP